ncbi:hypothetical protein [Streptomyces albogriseolus]|uniref:hypothetical protein n=1 Tax=Streptomyces albogriseolus TaxID=1887 RepID=UPI003460B177
MKIVLSTWWTVTDASYAEDNGVSEDLVERDLGWYLSSSINDVPVFDEAEGYATVLSTPRREDGWQLDGTVTLRIDWLVKVDRAKWLAARGLDPRAAARTDLGRQMVWELYHLGSVCETDAVVRAEFHDGRGVQRIEMRPEHRKR